MTIRAHIICHSVSPNNERAASLQLRYPKFIHGEFLTHRKFTRNSSSSRAIPVRRLIADCISDPVNPSFWGKDQPGMQAAEELTGEALVAVKTWWARARHEAVQAASIMAASGAHKQIVNRIIEPFSHINTVVTSTEWANFRELRCHEAAMPEMHELADSIMDALANSTPVLRRPGEWHLPYVRSNEIDDHGGITDPTCILRKVSVARCARVSYLTHEAKASTVEEDAALYDKLVGSRPRHASPAEHQCTPDVYGRSPVHGYGTWSRPDLHGNFDGFIQLRKLIEVGAF
jgi:thymidylate synthase ThyX